MDKWKVLYTRMSMFSLRFCVYLPTVISGEEVDIILQRSEGGVDSALTYAKTISKYMKDLIGYVEKKLALGRTVDSLHHATNINWNKIYLFDNTDQNFEK